MKPRPLRPRFELVVPLPPARVLQRLRRHLAEPYAPCTGAIFAGHAVLRPLPDDRRVWSPELSLDVAPHRDGALIRGTFAPRSGIWSLVIFCYAFIGFSAFVGLAWGLAQWTLERPAWALWSVPGAVAAAGLVWAGAQVGQRLGQEQIALLRRFLDYALSGEV